MDSQKRLLVALALSFGLTVAYTMLVVRPQQEREAKAKADAEAAALLLPSQKPPALAPPGAAPAPGEAAAAAPAAAKTELPVLELERRRPQTRYVFSSQGAGLLHAELLGERMREQPQVSVSEGLGRLTGKRPPPPPQVDMAVPAPGRPLPMAVSIEGSQPFPADLRYQVVEGSPPNELAFLGSSGSWEVKKTFRWEPASFESTMTVELKNIGPVAARGELALHFDRRIDPGQEHKGSFFGGVGNESRAACYVADKFQHVIPNDKPPLEEKGAVSFFGIDQQYFLAAIFPLEKALEGRCVLTATPSQRSVDAYFPLEVAPGQTVVHRFGTFIGPKDIELLESIPSHPTEAAVAAAFRPPLEKTVDFGIWAVICKVLLTVLKVFHRWVGNWGMAIILLTVVVKLVLLPLTHKSMVSAEAMKKLQPKMEAIKQKYPDDRERQNAETMKLYQEAKVNPLGGCLPMLFQLPVWAALYTTLRVSYELYGEPFISPLWTDLTYKDPTYVLPLALGITMVITQRLQPQMMDAAQARIMTYAMPVFFTVIMLNYPAGLALYIFTNNLLTIVQQYGLRRYLEKKGVVEPKGRTEKQERPKARSAR